MMSMQGARSLLAEPRPAAAQTAARADRVLVALLLPATIFEGVFRGDLVWRPAVVALGAVLALSMLWRRRYALWVFLLGFGALHTVSLAALMGKANWVDPYSGIIILLAIYSLFRWSSGREAAVGLAFIAIGYGVSAIQGEMKSVAEAVAGAVLLLFPAVLATAVRFRASMRLREIDRVKLLEREMLARELHDTVAHHVSAIAIQAQAGRVVAASRPDMALSALATIEEAAARTLAELRTIVGALRGQDAELAPQHGIADVQALARGTSAAHSVSVSLSGNLEDLRPSLEAGLYRLAQESITNATRHARDATQIWVTIEEEAGSVQLIVQDDGKTSASGAGVKPASGFGLVGMAERAALLGGTFDAGPSADGGWKVHIVLPRDIVRQ